MSMSMKFDAFVSYYNQGLAAYENGDYAQSRQLMLKAAEICEELSRQQPSAEMQKEFQDKGRGIIEFIRKKLTYKETIPSVDNTSGKPSSSQKTDGEFSGSFKPLSKFENKVTLDDVAGLDDVKDMVKKLIILPLKAPETFKSYGISAGGAVLMYGPPGTGKTMIAKAIASEVEANFFLIPSDKIVDKYIGDTEKKISELFSTARANLPAVIFFDEFDSIASLRSDENKVAQAAVPALLAQMDGVKNNLDNLLIVAATNMPWAIDPAILSRCEHVYLPMPDMEGRAKIFHLNLSKQLSKADDIDYIELAKKTENFNGRDISNICKKVRRTLAERHTVTGKSQVCTQEDVIAEINLLLKKPHFFSSAKFEEFYSSYQR